LPVSRAEAQLRAAGACDPRDAAGAARVSGLATVALGALLDLCEARLGECGVKVGVHLLPL
jgi:hypothetical protein